MSAPPLLLVEALQLTLGTLPVLRGVDLTLERGQLLGLIGPNGSGKTSLIRTLTGLLPATQGRVLIDGIDIQQDPLAARRQLGFAPEPGALPG